MCICGLCRMAVLESSCLFLLSFVSPFTAKVPYLCCFVAECFSAGSALLCSPCNCVKSVFCFFGSLLVYCCYLAAASLGLSVIMFVADCGLEYIHCCLIPHSIV